MTDIQKYFISLLSSHLNNEIPEPIQNIEWVNIFKLAELHNLTGIVALEIKKLPAEFQPSAKGKSYFNQALGMTIQNVQIKNLAIDEMSMVLSNASIKHTIIKGGAIRKLYPVPEVRTSGDTDVVIDINDMQKVKATLIDNDFILTSESANQIVLKYNEQEFQFKTYFDCLNNENSTFFNLDLCDSENEFTYYLKPTYHLVYVINHLLKHLKSGGVGLRQLMDVDVLIRNDNVDTDEVLNICDRMNIGKSTRVVLALSKSLFKTPINIDYNIDESLYNHLTEIMITGGVFGFANANSGTVRLVNHGSKFKAFMNLLFPSKEYMYNTYLYANKRHYLLPLAYIQRAFYAMFKRRKQNVNNIKSIMNDDEIANSLSSLQKELEI